MTHPYIRAFGIDPCTSTIDGDLHSRGVEWSFYAP